MNVLLYAVFAARCTLKASATTQSTGFLSFDHGGRSEFLTVYDGMELGLALMFSWMAWRPLLNRTGLAIALLICAPMVAFRLIGCIRLWPVQRTTLATGAPEIALLLTDLLLWFVYRPAAV